MLSDFLKLIPATISTWWLAPILGIVFGGWLFWRRQKELARELETGKEKVANLQAELDQQKKSNELLHKGMFDIQQHKAQLDTLLADARSLLRATADSIVIRSPYAEDALVFLMVHGPAAHRIAKMQIALHGSQAGNVFVSRQTSIYSAQAADKTHEKRVDTKSGYQSRNILTKPLLKFGAEAVGVVQFLNEDDSAPFTPADEARIEPICVKLALAVSHLIADPARLIQLGVVLDPHINKATILFSDITNSDLLFQKLPVADATALIDEYLERLGAIGVTHGARVDKYVGDGMMLSFETAGPGNARQALHAAIAMQREFKAIAEEWQRVGYKLDALGHRIGIASGPVYGRRMGYGASSAFTIMGAPVNLAAHLCDYARDAKYHILLCNTTEEAARNHLPAGYQLKPFAVPKTAAYEVRQEGV
ncbi:MAG TPA: adenylate/guanylate cyclase domain-containing protein [Burkholderiales bacterium]